MLFLRNGLKILVLTRFLDANRCLPPDQVRGHASLENALAKDDPALRVPTIKSAAGLIPPRPDCCSLVQG
jgi:hypothetical protein